MRVKLSPDDLAALKRLRRRIDKVEEQRMALFAERTVLARRLKGEGASLAEIADPLGVSRVRVRMITQDGNEGLQDAHPEAKVADVSVG